MSLDHLNNIDPRKRKQMRNIKNIVVVGLALVICTFGLTKSCSATQVEQKSEQQIQSELVEKLNKDIAEAKKTLAEADSLSQKMATATLISKFEEVKAMLIQQQPQAVVAQPDTRSYVQKAGQEFSDLVPVYAGNEVERPSGFGATYAKAMTKAEAEDPAVAAVKVAVVERLQEAHTKQVLDQDALHIPEYSQLLKQAPRNEVVLETIQQERLKDEQAVEALENPGFWTTVKWWWKS
jgi:hypothetical protein